MGTATGHDVHVDIPLSNVAIAYKPSGFIGEEICPVVPVNKQSDSYNIWSQADMFRVEDDRRAPGAEANVITTAVSSDTYFCDNYALKDRLPYEDIQNADAGWIFTERAFRAEFVKSKLMLGMDKRVSDLCTSTSNVGSSSTTASGWTDYTNSDPISDILTGILNVQRSTGYKPNSIVFGDYAWHHFRNHDDVVSRVYGDSTTPKGRVITQNQIANLFEMERCLVAGAYENTGDEGQTASLANLWDDNVLIYYAPLRPRRDVPSFMYSFRWKKIADLTMTAEVHQLPRAKAEEVEVGYYQDEKITASTLGFLQTGVGSSQ